MQITMAETFGLEGRGTFYEEVGAVRDVVQNHLLQVAALLVMEPPAGSGADAVREAKSRALGQMQPVDPRDTVRGQFRGYRAEPGVAPASAVETFAAVRIHVDNPRWRGVPFLVRAGKRLPVTATEVFATLRRAPTDVFDEGTSTPPNHVRFRVGPAVETALGALAKVPGERMLGGLEELVVHDTAADEMAPYERLLGDAMRGDPTLFAREDAVEASWRIVEPVLGDVVPVREYEAGTWGPAEAAALAADIGGWHDPAPSREGVA